MSDENTELKNALVAVREATAALEAKAAKNEGGTAELKAIVEKANKKLDELEVKNQELVKKQAEDLKAAEELKQQVKDLEVKAAKFGSARFANARDEIKALEKKALKSFCEGGSAGLEADEKKYLRADNNADGGFLMATAFDDMVLKPITEISALRSVATVKRVDALKLQMALRSSLVTSYWTGEGEGMTASNSKYARPEIPVNSVTTKTLITLQALLGGQWDMESELMGDFAESRAQLEGAAFVNGDGVKKPRGFMAVAAAVPTKNSGFATTYNFDSLIDLTGEVKTAYKPMFGFKRKELAHIRTLKVGTGTDAYAWQPGNGAAGVPSTLAGYPYIELPDMADRGSGAKPVIFADFRKLYTIVDAFNAIMLRNPYASDGYVTFSLQSFLGGDVVMPEAGCILVCAE